MAVAWTGCGKTDESRKEKGKWNEEVDEEVKRGK
jgi:hypothetical protein